MENILIYIQIAGAGIFAIAMIVFLIKMFIKKADKNKNGKIESEEISEADLQFTKEMIKESIKTIASGLLNLSGITGKNAYNMLYSQVKASKKIFEEVEEQNKTKTKGEQTKWEVSKEQQTAQEGHAETTNEDIELVALECSYPH